MATSAEQSRQISDLHAAWTRQQVARGVDGPVPAGRPTPSDYNLHVPDLESDGAAMDELHDQIRAIMGLAPLEAV